MAPHAVFRSYRMATQATGGLAVEWEVLKQGGETTRGWLGVSLFLRPYQADRHGRGAGGRGTVSRYHAPWLR